MMVWEKPARQGRYFCLGHGLPGLGLSWWGWRMERTGMGNR